VTHTDPSSDVLAQIGQIPDGGFHEVEARWRGDDTESLILFRDGDAVRAWLNVCPHAGRRMDWAPGRFLKDKQGQLVCAVHGATFELVGGQCVAGPCRGSSMHAVPVVVDGDLVRIVRTSG
jgi:nitrite reductase/ring-hydroxylating ferredoxin subunit